MFAFVFSLDKLNFLSYSVSSLHAIVTLGMVATVGILFWERKRKNLSPAIAILIFMIYYIGDNLLSRVVFAISHIFFHHDFFSQRRFLYFIPVVGRVYFGALVSAIVSPLIGTAIYGKRKEYANYLDLFLPSFVVFMLFARISTFFTHLHPGSITAASWGFYYAGAVRHEPSLYEAISLAVLFCIIWLVRKKIRKTGFLSAFIVCWLALSRFVTDFFRSRDLPNSEIHFSNGVTINQIVYLAVFIISLNIFIKLFKNRAEKQHQILN